MCSFFFDPFRMLVTLIDGGPDLSCRRGGIPLGGPVP
jgi:hypothetical protein